MLPKQLVNQLKEKSKKFGTRTILVQLPDGLKPKALEIARELEKLGFKPIISGDSCFGACDLRFLENAITLHIGHSKLIDDPRVVYWEYRLDTDPTEAIAKGVDKIKEKNLCLVTTVQHLDFLEKARLTLERAGKSVSIGKGLGHPGQVLGCDASAVGECDAVVFIGTGVFHPMFIAMQTGKKVYAIDPYTKQMQIVTGEKLVKEKYLRITKAKNAKRIGIVTSSKPGQQNLAVANKVKASLEDKGKETVMIIMDDISPEKLENIGLDAYVITACPRIVIDDWKNYKMPILLPDEAKDI